MKRTILVVFLGLVLVMLGGVGFTVLYYMTLPKNDGRKNDPPKPGDPPPFSYKELEDFSENPDKASKEIPRIIACFDNGDEDVRLMAAETLKNVGAKAVGPLRERLTDSNASVRFWCVQSLAYIGPAAADAAGDIVKRLKDDDSNVRYKAVYALGKLGDTSDPVIDGLLTALSDPDEGVSETAVEVLDNFGTPKKESLPLLAELAGKDSKVRGVALKLLGRMGEPAAPTFKALLKKANALDQIELIQAIAQLGPGAKSLLPDLEAIMIKSPFWDAQDDLVGAFKKCGPDGARGLANVLKTLAPQFIANDARAAILLKSIGEIGPEAKGTVPLLIDLLKEREALRPGILDALGGIGPAASEAIPAVEALVQNANNRDDPAVVALRRMGKIIKK